MITEQAGRAIVMERSQGRCELCGRQGLGVHHRLKRSAGGTWSPANLLRLCGSGTTGCHGRVEAEPVLAEQLGLWTLRHQDEGGRVLCRPTMFWTAWWVATAEGMWEWVENATELDLLHFRRIIM